MKTLYYFLITSVLLCCVFTSCKKSSVKPKQADTANTLSSQGMKYTINGDTSSFPLCLTYDSGTNNVQTNTTIEGYSLVGGTLGAKVLKLSLYHTGALKAGDTFTGFTSNPLLGVAAYYTPDGDESSFSSQLANPQATLTIDEVTSDHIKGTFTVKLFLHSDTAGSHVVYTITNGKFYAQVTAGA